MRRNTTVDILRAFAMLLIVLAHTHCPAWLNEIREFDVVMCVILAGFSYQCSISAIEKRSYIAYLAKRLKKLLLPTYGILILIFGVSILINRSFEPITAVKMKESFLLYDGIGYVWFVRVMLILAISTPLVTMLFRLAQKGQCHLLVLLIWTGVYIAAVTIYNAGIFNVYFNYYFLYLFVLYFLGYGIIYYFGYAYSSLKAFDKICTVAVSAVLVIAELARGASISSDKYPPGALYLSYGTLCFIVLYEIVKRLNIQRCLVPVEYISQNSFTIYLLHIVPLMLIKYCDKISAFTQTSFLVEYIFIVVCTALLLLMRSIITINVLKPFVLKRDDK